MTRNLMRTTLAAGLAWAALLAAGPAAGSGPTGAGEPFGMLSVDEVSGRLGQPGFHVLDANDAKKYASAHVPGAIRVAYREFSEKDLPADRGATLVFYCANTR